MPHKLRVFEIGINPLLNHCRKFPSALESSAVLDLCFHFFTFSVSSLKEINPFPNPAETKIPAGFRLVLSGIWYEMGQTDPPLEGLVALITFRMVSSQELNRPNRED